MKKTILKTLMGAALITTLMQGGAKAVVLKTTNPDPQKVEVILIAKGEDVISPYDGITVKLQDNDFYFELSDGSWGIHREEKNLYEFQPVELGDWSYTVKDEKELMNITQTYIDNKNYK